MITAQEARLNTLSNKGLSRTIAEIENIITKASIGGENSTTIHLLEISEDYDGSLIQAFNDIKKYLENLGYTVAHRSGDTFDIYW